MSRRLALLWLGLALLSGAGGTAWAAFGATTQSATMTFSVKPDLTAPTVVRVSEYREGGGTAEGSIRQGGDYRLYVEVSETGNPASGIASVTADASSFDSGQTAVPMSTTGCPCTVAGYTFSHRSAVLTADTGLTTGQRYDYTHKLTDTAGNVRTSNHYVFIETYATAVSATAGLVGHWRLGETTGTAAADAKATNPGTYNGSPTLGQTGALAGDANRAVLLDGVDDHVSVPDSASLDLADGPFTLEAWVKLSDANSGTQEIINKGANSWSMSFGNDAGLFKLAQDGGTDITSHSRTVDTSRFQHYVVTKSGTATRLYVDGVDVTGPISDRTLVNTTLPLMFGRDADTTGTEWLRGTIDEPAVYNQVLPPAQVLDHYRAGKGTG